jgi:hypothetical protein
MSQSWIQTHFPINFDTTFSNKQVAEKLKIMIYHPIHSNFILRGPHCSGKKTFLKIYLNYVDPSQKFTFFLNCSNTKNYDIKTSLYLFIDKKIDTNTNSNHSIYKYIVIKNLEKFPSQFYYILYNLLSNNSVIVIILETKEILNLETWCLIFTLHEKTTKELLSIGRFIAEKENYDISDKLLIDLVTRSKLETYTFIIMLQCSYMKIYSWLQFTKYNIEYEFILSEYSLKKRLLMIKNIESQGYSLEDITINLYSYVCNNNTLMNLPYLVELGNAIEKYENCEYKQDFLIYAISNIWKLQNKHKFPPKFHIL